MLSLDWLYGDGPGDGYGDGYVVGGIHLKASIFIPGAAIAYINKLILQKNIFKSHLCCMSHTQTFPKENNKAFASFKSQIFAIQFRRPLIFQALNS